MTDFALVVGVDHYLEIARLRAAERDARLVHQWLCDPGGGGVDEKHAHLLVSGTDPRALTQNRIDDCLEALLEAANQVDAGRLYFYFAGHGATHSGRSHDTALLLPAWSCRRGGLALSARDYEDYLASLGLFAEVAMFLDCCRTLIDQASGQRSTITFRRAAPRTTHTFIAHAAVPRKAAFEHTGDGEPRGIFTHCLLGLLQQANGGISADDLKYGLVRAVTRLDGEQEPIVRHDLPANSVFGPHAQPDRRLPTNEPAAPAGAPLRISVEDGVQVNVYDARGELCHHGDGAVELVVPPGQYRVQLRRYGRSVSHDVDHARTELALASPPLDSPAPIAGPSDPPDHRARDQSHAGPARHFSLVDTAPPMGTPPHVSRLFVLVRRGPGAAPDRVPSEPLTVHDVAGRPLAAISPATGHADHAAGYLAWSCAVEPGTYRLRAVRSRRDVAITIPAYRAAHVFVVDSGALRIDDLRVSLVPHDQPFEPASPIHRAMEGVVFALSTPSGELPAEARALLPDAAGDDLCFGMAAAHLALSSGDQAMLARILDRLEFCIPELPDLELLDRARPGSTRELRLALEAPPLLHASLALAIASDAAALAPDGPVARAMRTGRHDSIWCTWSDRALDELALGSTIDDLRGRRPELDAAALATLVGLPRSLVDPTLQDLDATLPARPGTGARRAIDVPGYLVGDILGRGAQSTVVHAVRQRDGREVALKVIPLHDAEHRRRAQNELNLLERIDHPAVLAFTAHGTLPGGAGVWLESELCRGSVLDRVADAHAPLAVDAALAIVLQALDGLAYLHEHHVIHRDIKPSNLLITGDDRVVIGDFGLARSLLVAPISKPGTARGTIPFAAPEQLRSSVDASPASDVWSMAATLYFLLTLDVPRERYAGQSEIEAAQLNPIVPLAERRPDVPATLASCLDRALAQEVELRPLDGAALRSALQAALAATQPG